MATFSGHESFPFRYTWLTKGVVGCAGEHTIFQSQHAMVTLGVGKNMVQSIRYWCLAARVIREDGNGRDGQPKVLRPTELGARLFLGEEKWDPYLEDTGTLWLLHWLLATHREKATTIYYAFNEHNNPEIRREELQHALATVAAGIPSVRASQNTLRRDVEIFLRTYSRTRAMSEKTLEDSLDCPLVELGLLYETGDGHYSFARGPKDTLPDAMLIYALNQYARWKPGQRTFRFEELAYRPLGPGRVFKLDEPALAERLERLADFTGGAWQFSETAGLKQAIVTRDIDAMRVLENYYRGRAGVVNRGGQ
ncbi:MAG: DUF4007 family protein [Chloroflexi bacterium]|nr:DUF4007 family protein [Chloroflexota bacterium]